MFLLLIVHAIHHPILEGDTVFNHESDNFFQTFHHEPGLCLFPFILRIVLLIQVIDLIVQFFLQVVELKTEIVDDLGDLLLVGVRVTRLGQSHSVGMG